MSYSKAQLIALLPKSERDAIFAQMTVEEQENLRFDWSFWSRPEQRAPTQNPNSPDGRWSTWLLLSGRGFGKRLCIETPIPTPSGWVKNGHLKAGDEIFDEVGRVCRVVEVHPISVEQNAWRVNFSDGAFIDACGQHLWTTWTHRDRKEFQRKAKQIDFPENWWSFSREMRTGEALGPKTRATTDILKTLTIGSRRDANHSIPTAQPLELPEICLPLDSYILGYWLGNGDVGKSGITAGSYKGDFDDHHVLDAVEAAGFEHTEQRIEAAGQTRITVLRLISHLRAAGVSNGRRIPEIYQRSSVAQRLALLRGISDSDGTAVNSHIEICSKSAEFADDIRELLIGLGEKPTISIGEAKIGDRSFGPKYRVTWIAARHNPFSLPRKAINGTPTPGLRVRERMIESIEKIRPKPMRCITVDSPSGLYLASRWMIPTHNTRTAAEFVREEVESGRRRSVGLVGQTIDDARKVMVEGVSGILTISHPSFLPIFEPSNRRLVWPNGAMAHLFSAEESSKLRGPNFDLLWYDEICAFGGPDQAQEIYDMGTMCLRIPGPLGHAPCEVITTTPKPMPLLRQIMKSSDTVITGGSTFDNVANLDQKTLERWKKKYEGTRLGRQELYGIVLDSFEGALWNPMMLDNNRCKLGAGEWKLVRGDNSGMVHLVSPDGDIVYFKRIIVSIDPAGSANRKSNETGIVVAALGEDEDGYLLADHSGIYSPEQWGTLAVDLFHEWGADRIIAEQNYGGDMVKANILASDHNVPVKLVTATRGKRIRAEPISTLYEQNRVHHVGQFEDLEDQLVTWDPFGKGDSPDRLDALVWGFIELMLKRKSNLDNVRRGYQGPIPIYGR